MTQQPSRSAEDFHSSQAARTSRVDSLTVELRGECPRHTVDFLDACSLAENVTRTALVNKILGDWEKEQRHKLSVINRVLGINPTASDATGVINESGR